MLHYALRLDEVNKTLSDIPKLAIYEEFYGFTTKDLGLYALYRKARITSYNVCYTKLLRLGLCDQTNQLWRV